MLKEKMICFSGAMSIAKSQTYRFAITSSATGLILAATSALRGVELTRLLGEPSSLTPALSHGERESYLHLVDLIQ